MRSVQGDDAAAFDDLYHRHALPAWRLALSICRDGGRAEDAVQEAFFAAWRSRATYDGERGSVASWLMTLVRNRSIDSLRREAAARRTQIPYGDHHRPDAGTRSLQDEVIARTEADALRASLRHLPDAQAEVIELAYYGQLSHSEIAARLCLPAGTVKGRMRLGLEKLREQIGSTG